MAPSSADALTLELYVRSLSPADGPITRNVNRLRGLESRDSIGRGTVVVWGREVRLSRTVETTVPGQFFLDRVASFRSWADDCGVSLEPFFGTREVCSSITGEEYTTLTLPVCCLAEYEDGDLRHVSPHSDGRAVCAVADRLGRLADATTTDRPPEARIEVSRR